MKGERNTRFFHLSSLVKKKKRLVYALQDSNGNWIHDDDMLNKWFGIFMWIYTPFETNDQCVTDDWQFSTLFHSNKSWLNHDISEHEIKRPIFRCGLIKLLVRMVLFLYCFQNIGLLLVPHVFSLFIKNFREDTFPLALSSSLITSRKRCAREGVSILLYCVMQCSHENYHQGHCQLVETH